MLDNVLPELAIAQNHLTENGALPPQILFDKNYKRFTLEIGFGDGGHLHALMQREPETGFLGVEPFTNGMAAFLKSIESMAQHNVRLLMEDAMILVRSLAPECLNEIYILNPDPWHKKRHHKRRIVNPDNLEHFARILKPGGALTMSTDVPDLGEWMVTHSMNHPEFEWTAECAQDWQNPPAGWITTTYETKQAKGADKMVYLLFRKKAK